MQVGSKAYSCQFHPEVCDHTMSEWMKIPGIPEALEQLLGLQGVEDFKISVGDHLQAHNAAANQLFHNWCELVFDT